MIAEHLREIHSRIEQAAARASRPASEITLVAVSKHQSIEAVCEALSAGQIIFGENYVQEGLEKQSLFRDEGHEAEFHLIGPLQSNKVKLAVGRFSLIHTLFRREIALEIEKRAAERGIVQRVLIQVNTSGETSKSGIASEDVLEFAEFLQSFVHLRLEGLMMIGSYVATTAPREERVREFQLLREVRDAVVQKGIELRHLSMGMSHDYELAIEEGATIIRIGSALFGSRS